MRKFGVCTLVLGAALGSLASLVLPLQSAPKETERLTLRRVYEYKGQRKWTGKMLATLDADSRFLYIAEWGMGRVLKIDWRASKVVKEADFSSLPCVRQYALGWNIKDPQRIVYWHLLPDTPYGHMGYCNSEYFVDTRSLEIVRKLNENASFSFLPKVGQVLLSRSHGQEAPVRRELRRIDTWELVREWDDPAGTWPLLSQDERYAFYMTERKEPGEKPAACEVAVQELTTGRLVDRWELSQGSRECPGALQFLGTNSEVVVAFSPDPHVVISLRSIKTGDTLHTIRMERIIPKSHSLSPDGKYVVAGAWDDPGDSLWSRDFVIWDLQTGEVVYQTSKYLSRWGSRTHGREVYPSFSPDGKYLILVKESSVELLQIIAPPSATSAN